MIRGKTHEQNKKEWATLEKWHRWFAWRPVQLQDGRVAWLCWLNRRLEWSGSYDGPYLVRQYKLP